MSKYLIYQGKKKPIYHSIYKYSTIKISKPSKEEIEIYLNLPILIFEKVYETYQNELNNMIEIKRLNTYHAKRLLLITLHKLRRGLSYTTLTIIYGISRLQMQRFIVLPMHKLVHQKQIKKFNFFHFLRLRFAFQKMTPAK